MGFWAEQVDENVAAKVAIIAGESSASSQAIGELARRRAAGEDVVLVRPLDSKRTLLVIPRSHMIDSVVPLP